MQNTITPKSAALPTISTRLVTKRIGTRGIGFTEPGMDVSADIGGAGHAYGAMIAYPSSISAREAHRACVR